MSGQAHEICIGRIDLQAGGIGVVVEKLMQPELHHEPAQAFGRRRGDLILEWATLCAATRSFSLVAACTLSKALSHFMNNSTSFSSITFAPLKITTEWVTSAQLASTSADAAITLIRVPSGQPGGKSVRQATRRDKVRRSSESVIGVDRLRPLGMGTINLAPHLPTWCICCTISSLRFHGRIRM